MSTDDNTENLYNKGLKLIQMREAGEISSDEYEKRMGELKQDVDSYGQKAVEQLSEAIKPYLENDIPFDDPSFEILHIETLLFERLKTHWTLGISDPGHPSGVAYPPYFAMGAAALHGAGQIFEKLLVDSDYLLEGGYGIHNTNSFKLLEEGYDVSHDDYIAHFAILTMPLMNRLFWAQSQTNSWNYRASEFHHYRRIVTETYYDNLFDEPDGNDLSEAFSNMCMGLYEGLESDNESTGDNRPHAYKPNESLVLASLLMTYIDSQDTEVIRPNDFDDLFKIFKWNKLNPSSTYLISTNIIRITRLHTII